MGNLAGTVRAGIESWFERMPACGDMGCCRMDCKPCQRLRRERLRMVDALETLRAEHGAAVDEIARLRARCAELEADLTRLPYLFTVDRLRQYEIGSGIVAALEELAERFRTGEHVEAWKHGELDDLREEFAARLGLRKGDG